MFLSMTKEITSSFVGSEVLKFQPPGVRVRRYHRCIEVNQVAVVCSIPQAILDSMRVMTCGARSVLTLNVLSMFFKTVIPEDRTATVAGVAKSVRGRRLLCIVEC